MLRSLISLPTALQMAITGLAAITMVACSAPDPKNAPAQNDIVTEAQSQRKQWNDLKVRRYTITYVLIEGNDSVKPAYRLVKAIDTGVLDTNCPNGICPTLHLRDLRTIPDLFTLIVDSAGACNMSAVYHARWHYPTIVRADCARSGKPDFRVIVQDLALEP